MKGNTVLSENLAAMRRRNSLRLSIARLRVLDDEHIFDAMEELEREEDEQASLDIKSGKGGRPSYMVREWVGRWRKKLEAKLVAKRQQLDSANADLAKFEEAVERAKE